MQGYSRRRQSSDYDRMMYRQHKSMSVPGMGRGRYQSDPYEDNYPRPLLPVEDKYSYAGYPKHLYDYPEPEYRYPEDLYEYADARYKYPELPYDYPEAPYDYPALPYDYPEAPYDYPDVPYDYPEEQYEYPAQDYGAYRRVYAPYENPPPSGGKRNERRAVRGTPRGRPYGETKSPRRIQNKPDVATVPPVAHTYTISYTEAKHLLDKMKENMPKNEDHLMMYCPVCDSQSKTKKGYERHSGTTVHQANMAKIGLLPYAIQKQFKTAMQDIDKLYTRLMKLTFCELCNTSLKVPYSLHKILRVHKARNSAVFHGCNVCSTGPFKTFPDFLKHFQTDDHIQKNQDFQDFTLGQIAAATEIDDYPEYVKGVAYGSHYIQKTTAVYCNVCKTSRSKDDVAEHVTSLVHFKNVVKLYRTMKDDDTFIIDMGDYPPMPSNAEHTESETKETEEEVEDMATE